MRALMAAGILAGEEGDRAVARERFVEALALAEETGDAFWRNRLVANLGTLALFEGDHEEAIDRYETALAAAEDDWVRSLMLHNLASAYAGLGRRDRAIELLDESIEIARTVANPVHLSSTLRTLARMLLQEERESPRALALLRESLEIARDLDERPGHRRVPRDARGRGGPPRGGGDGSAAARSGRGDPRGRGSRPPARRDAVDPRGHDRAARHARRGGVRRRDRSAGASCPPPTP